jgi:transposase
MTSGSGKTRRRYGAQFKAMVLAQCDEPGASVAQVAMSHGINDNVVHRWRQLARQRQAAQRVAVTEASGPAPAQFVPLALPAPATAEVKTEVRLEVRRAAVAVSIAWPEHALGDLAGFVRELLK